MMVRCWCVMAGAAAASLGWAAGEADVVRRAAAYAAYFEAHELLTQGRDEDARRKLEDVLAADPEAGAVHSALARVCLRNGDVGCAESRALRAVELAPADAAGHKVLAEIDLQRRRSDHDAQALEHALEHLAAAAAAEPGDASVWAAWIRVLAGEGRWELAEDVARQAAGVPGLDPAAPFMTLVRILIGRGEANEAVTVLERADVSGQAAIPLLETLADLKAGRGDLAGQVAALERLRALRPEDAGLAHRLGATLLELGDFFGAEAALREAFLGREADPLVRRDFARALVRLGRGSEALPLLADLPPVQRAPHTLFLWAQAAEQAGRFGEAADRLEELVRGLSGTDAESFGRSLRLRAGEDRRQAGQFAEALALTAGQEGDPLFLRLRIDALDALGRTEEVDQLLRLNGASQAPPAAVLALLARRSSQRGGGVSAGVGAAVAALQGAPDREATASLAGLWLTHWGDAELGARLLDSFDPLPKPEPGLLRARGSTLFAAGRLPEAEAAFRQLLKLMPDDEATLNDLGFLLVTKGGAAEEALGLLERAVKLRPDEAAYLDSLGWALHQAGRSAEALPLLRRAAQQAGRREEPDIREHLGDVHSALGDAARAQAEWQAALALGSEQRQRIERKLRDLNWRGRSR